MQDRKDYYKRYFSHLQRVSIFGRLYKRFYSSLVLYIVARRFGRGILEVGAGIGSGVLGSFPKHVHGLDINPYAVEYCRKAGLSVEQIKKDGSFPIEPEGVDCCILDNVLEHIEEPGQTLDECYRVTQRNGGLIIVVPGLRGYDSDTDHKKYYDKESLYHIGHQWKFIKLFSIPTFFTSEILSRYVKTYCLVAVYKKC
jgi:SAM-dependent methyltransferase